MTGYSAWIRDKRLQQLSTATPRYSRPKVDFSEEYWPAPFSRQRIIAEAIRQVDYLQRWIADPFTPPVNRYMFEQRLVDAIRNRDRALKLQAKLPPEWTGPQQPTML